MRTIMAFIKSHPILTYFALAFAISWGGMLLILGGAGASFPGTNEQVKSLLGPLYLVWITGPSVAGILLTGLLYGKAGLLEFGSRLLRWRVGARWYAVALLSAPLLATAVLLGLSLAAPEYLPRLFIANDKAALLLRGILAGLTVGIFEELGWTGFAVSKMRLRYGVLGTGLIVGFVVAVWNFLVVFWATDATSTAGALPLAIFVPAVLFTWLPAYRVLMVWVYERTESLLLAMLMHTSLVASWTILTPMALSGVTLVTYHLVFTTALWLVVGAIALAQGGHLSRVPPRRRVA
jgi:membrane protease YdiL (CAAX protease family)